MSFLQLVAYTHIHFLKCHRNISDGEIAQAKSIYNVGVKTSKVINYLAYQSGGSQNMGFMPKDMYNFLNSERMLEV